jgi:hypothetical protein
MHSGLQFGGAPTYPPRQEQAGVDPETWHRAFGPQGFGTHGFSGTTGSLGGAGNDKTIYKRYSKLKNVLKVLKYIARNMNGNHPKLTVDS